MAVYTDHFTISPDSYCMIFLFSEKTTEAKMMKAGGTEIGKTLAEKSRGLFSANDWQCKTYVFQIIILSSIIIYLATTD